MKNWISTFIAILALSACAQLGLATPQSLDQKLGATVATVTSIETGAAQALQVKAISVADAKEILDLSAQIRTLIIDARALEHVDISTANGKYALAFGILTQLQNYTNSRGIK